MPIVRAFLALLAGFATRIFLVTVATAAVRKLALNWVGAPGSPRVKYVLVNLAYSLMAAVAGGYVTAWAAAENPLKHTLILALAILLLSALTPLQQRGQQPIWYQLLLIAIMPASVFAGGVLRLKGIGI